MTNTRSLTAGVDTFVGVAGDNNVFRFTPSTLQGTDTITGGATDAFFDVMVATGAGTVGAARFAGATNIEELFLSSGGNSVTLTDGLVAGTSFGFFTVIDGGGSDVIDASAITSRPIVFFAGAGTDTFKGGQGDDAVFILPTDLTLADTIQGGMGTDVISFNAGGSVAAAAFTNVTGIEGIVLDGAGNNVTLSNALVAGSDTGTFGVVDGVGNDVVDASGVTTPATIVFLSNGGTDTFRGGSGTNAFVFAPFDLTTADTLQGGSGLDNLIITTSGTLAASAFTNFTNLETLVLANGTNNVTLTNGLVAGTSIGYFAVAGSTGNDTVDASGVTNNVAVAFYGTTGGNDSFTGGNGNDAFVFTASSLDGGDTVQAGSGGVDILIITSAGTIAAAAFANVTGIEALALADGTNNLTLTNGLVAGTSLGYFIVSGNTGNDTVDGSGVTNNVAVAFYGTTGGNDSFTGGNGNDAFLFAAGQLTATGTVVGGGGADTLWMTTAGTTSTADLAGVTGIEGVFLQNGGTFNLANGITATATLAAVGSAAADTFDASAVTGYGVGFSGNGGADILKGGSQNDSFFISDDNFVSVNGNAGIDRIVLTDTSPSFDLTSNAVKIHNIEAISLENVAHGSVTLTGADIAPISGNNALYIVSDGDDVYEAGTGYTQIASGVTNDQVAAGHFFYEFQHNSGSFLFIDSNFYLVDISDGIVDVAPENGSVDRVVNSDPATYPAGTTVTHSLIGPDAALFNIDATTGDVTFKTSPDYETPLDQGHNNQYDFDIVTHTDRAEPGKFRIGGAIVTDINDNAPVFNSAGSANTAENVATTTPVYSAHATDADGTAANNTVSYSLAGGGDNDLFHINPGSGAVMFNNSPDYEAPLDADHDNQYDITVMASDGLLVHDVTLHVAIFVGDVLLA